MKMWIHVRGITIGLRLAKLAANDEITTAIGVLTMSLVVVVVVVAVRRWGACLE